MTKQLKCGRSVCSSVVLTHWNTSTEKWYCQPCAFKINEGSPGLCVLDEKRLEVIAVNCFKGDRYRWFKLPRPMTRKEAAKWCWDYQGMPAENFKYQPKT